jgi:hypothetical protein
MEKSLELFLRNKNIVDQNYALIEKNPRRFMTQGVWCTEYTIHLNIKISGLNVRGKIRNYENGEVETKLVFSTYGDNHISEYDYNRREKIIEHISKNGATYFEEPPIKWFN